MASLAGRHLASRERSLHTKPGDYEFQLLKESNKSSLAKNLSSDDATFNTVTYRSKRREEGTIDLLCFKDAPLTSPQLASLLTYQKALAHYVANLRMWPEYYTPFSNAILTTTNVQTSASPPGHAFYLRKQVEILPQEERYRLGEPLRYGTRVPDTQVVRGKIPFPPNNEKEERKVTQCIHNNVKIALLAREWVTIEEKLEEVPRVAITYYAIPDGRKNELIYQVVWVGVGSNRWRMFVSYDCSSDFLQFQVDDLMRWFDHEETLSGSSNGREVLQHLMNERYQDKNVVFPPELVEDIYQYSNTYQFQPGDHGMDPNTRTYATGTNYTRPAIGSQHEHRTNHHDRYYPNLRAQSVELERREALHEAQRRNAPGRSRDADDTNSWPNKMASHQYK
jgi:hypothetical protein